MLIISYTPADVDYIPQAPAIAGSTNITTFLFLSDVHVSAYEASRSGALTTLLTETGLALNPAKVIITGDLFDNVNPPHMDEDYEFAFLEEDARAYRSILQRAGVWQEKYVLDTLGNHDVYGLTELGADLPCAYVSSLSESGACAHATATGANLTHGLELPIFFDGAPVVFVHAVGFSSVMFPALPAYGSMDGALFFDTLDALGAQFDSAASDAPFAAAQLARMTFSHHPLANTFLESSWSTLSAEPSVRALGVRAHLSGHLHNVGGLFTRKNVLDLGGAALYDGNINTLVFDGKFGPYVMCGPHDAFPQAVVTAPPHAALAFTESSYETVWAGEMRVIVALPVPLMQLRAALADYRAWASDGSGTVNLTIAEYSAEDAAADPRLRAPEDATGTFYQHPGAPGTEHDGRQGLLLLTAPWEAPVSDGVIEFHLVLPHAEEVMSRAGMALDLATETVLYSPFSTVRAVSPHGWLNDAPLSRDMRREWDGISYEDPSKESSNTRRYFARACNWSVTFAAQHVLNPNFVRPFVFFTGVTEALLMCIIEVAHRVRRRDAAPMAEVCEVKANRVHNSGGDGSGFVLESAPPVPPLSWAEAFFFRRWGHPSTPLSFTGALVLVCVLPLAVYPRVYLTGEAGVVFLWQHFVVPGASSSYVPLPSLLFAFVSFFLVFPLQLFAFPLLRRAFFAEHVRRSRVKGGWHVRRLTPVERSQVAQGGALLLLLPAAIMVFVGVLADSFNLTRNKFFLYPAMFWVPVATLVLGFVQTALLWARLARPAASPLLVASVL